MASRNRVINADHEFSAPKLFNYRKGETEEHTHKALLLGDLSYAPSNSTSRTTGIKNLLNLRPRDLKIRNSKELDKEQTEKAQNFKARPLNKKILESKGELGLLCNKKRHVTIPKEFHFAINKRIPPRTTTHDAELYDKITLCLKSHNKKLIPRNTIPRPFHFHTEKRGAQKESKFVVIRKSSNGVTKSKSPNLNDLVMKERWLW